VIGALIRFATPLAAISAGLSFQVERSDLLFSLQRFSKTYRACGETVRPTAVYHCRCRTLGLEKFCALAKDEDTLLFDKSSVFDELLSQTTTNGCWTSAKGRRASTARRILKDNEPASCFSSMRQKHLICKKRSLADLRGAGGFQQWGKASLEPSTGQHLPNFGEINFHFLTIRNSGNLGLLPVHIFEPRTAPQSSILATDGSPRNRTCALVSFASLLTKTTTELQKFPKPWPCGLLQPIF